MSKDKTPADPVNADGSQSEEACEQPCDPTGPCEECEEYWERMRAEGLWLDGIGWSDAAMRSML